MYPPRPLQRFVRFLFIPLMEHFDFTDFFLLSPYVLTRAYRPLSCVHNVAVDRRTVAYMSDGSRTFILFCSECLEVYYFFFSGFFVCLFNVAMKEKNATSHWKSEACIPERLDQDLLCVALHMLCPLLEDSIMSSLDMLSSGAFSNTFMD